MMRKWQTAPAPTHPGFSALGKTAALATPGTALMYFVNLLLVFVFGKTVAHPGAGDTRCLRHYLPALSAGPGHWRPERFGSRH
jgi:hypothetical protein